MSAAPLSPALVASERFWAELLPGLTIGGLPAPAVEPRPGIGAPLLASLLEQGYFMGTDPWIARRLAPVAAGSEALGRAGLPQVLLFLFDEPWDLFSSLDPVLSEMLGDDYRLMPGFWAWRVGPGGAGWPTHRDRGRATLRPDGRPISLTVWLPLTEVGSENSCVHVVPIPHDPAYGTERELEYGSKTPTSGVVLAGRPGDFMGWNHALLHWGSEAGPCRGGPRASLSMEFQRGDAPPIDFPLIRPRPLLSFEQRLWLVAKQIVQYEHMERLPDPWPGLARDLAPK